MQPRIASALDRLLINLKISRKGLRTIIYIGIVALCIFLKIRHNLRGFTVGYDGGLYTDIAENIKEGRGFVTDLSLYHLGYTYFPHPTAVQPIWPLLYGEAAKILSLQIAGVWLPTISYLVALAFAYLWANSFSFELIGRPNKQTDQAFSGRLISGEPQSLQTTYQLIKAQPDRILSPGLAMMMLLGLNTKYFQYTSMPYTEGTAYALLFGALWRFNGILRSPNLLHKIEIAFWLAALTLVRSQFIIVFIAFGIGELWQIIKNREKKSWIRLIVTILFFSVLIGIQIKRMSYIIPQNRITALVRYDLARSNDLLAPVQATFAVKGIKSYVTDQLAGAYMAFIPFSGWSYSRVYILLPYVFLMAGFLLVKCLKKGRKEAAAANERTLGRMFPGNSLFYISLISGILLSLNMMHLNIHHEWHFSGRHGIIAIIPFFLGWFFIKEQGGRTIKAVANAAFVLTIVISIAMCWQIKESEKKSWAYPHLDSLLSWLSEKTIDGNRIIVAMPGPLPQIVAPWSPRVSFHWVYKGTSERDLETLFEVLGCQFLVVPTKLPRTQIIFDSVRPYWYKKYFDYEAKIQGFEILKQAEK